MIDEKKIEEAAINHISSNEYASYNSGEVEDEMILEKAKESFKAGINWFLDNLWHDASEEPKRDTENITFLVVECNDRSYRRFQIVKLLYDGGYEDIVYMLEVTRWLYLDDLLKGGNNG